MLLLDTLTARFAQIGVLNRKHRKECHGDGANEVFHIVAKQVVLVGATPIEEVRIVVDAADMMTKRIIKTLAVGNRRFMIAQMPFANVSRSITCLLKNLCHRHTVGRHSLCC